MKKPTLRIKTEKLIEFDDENNECEGGDNFVIKGNKEGLIHLLNTIVKVIDSDFDGYHTHIASDDPEEILRTKDTWLSIELEK